MTERAAPQPDLPGLAFSPAAERNRGPIAVQLTAHLPADAAIFAAAALVSIIWTPFDVTQLVIAERFQHHHFFQLFG